MDIESLRSVDELVQHFIIGEVKYNGTHTFKFLRKGAPALLFLKYVPGRSKALFFFKSSPSFSAFSRPCQPSPEKEHLSMLLLLPRGRLLWLIT